MSFTLTLEVAADPAKVFDFVADFTNTPKWYLAVQRVERISGSGGTGTEYAVYRQLPTGPVVNNVAITNYVDGSEITFSSVDGPTPFTYRYQVRSTPLGAQLTLNGSISAAGLPGPARLLGRAVEGLFKRGMADNLDTLRALIES